MNKAILKEFAIESRKDLIDRIKLKLNLFYVNEDFDCKINGDMYILFNENHTLNLTKYEKQKRDLLLKRIKEIGIDRVVEESAYTWFNRLIAIRYMEIHNFLPLGKNNESLGIRVLSSNDDTPNPEILKFSNLINKELDIGFNNNVYSYLNNENEKFKYILLLICNKMKKVFPDVFGGLTDYIDLLIPENILSDTGFISKMLRSVSAENFKEVEIIGWLYQFYNQTEKDRVISSKKIYKKHEIAYATQIFTPDWIVKYMVDNSLGKYYLEHGGNPEIKKDLLFYIEKELNVKEYIEPTKITFIDPCCGSGHILVYAFDVLYKIYELAGYNKVDIPELILENNIYGLDVDDRAGQLSILSILLKARQYDKNFFKKIEKIDLKVMSLKESVSLEENLYNNDLLVQSDISYLINNYNNAKEFGSLLLSKSIDFTESLSKLENNIFDNYLANQVKPLIKQNEILSKKYSIVVTNPPYMNNSLMSENMKNFLNKNYKVAKSDLFSAFIIRNLNFGTKDSYFGFMTPFVWMFISSYENLREYIIDHSNIDSLVQLEYSAFSEATVPICTFVLKNTKDANSLFINLSDYCGGMEIQKNKFLEFKNNKQNNYLKNIATFKQIKGFPMLYRASDNLIDIFINNKTIGNKYDAKVGIQTGNNDKFLRFWWEVDFDKINKKWFYHNKGGEFRKWYGNREYIINYENDGYDLKNYRVNGKLASRPQNLEYNFRPCVSWNLITSGSFSARYFDNTFTFNVAAPSCFPDEKNIYYILGLFNSRVIQEITKMLNPTLNMKTGDIGNIPLIVDNSLKNEIDNLVKECIEIEKDDWDSFETSYEFKKHPLLIKKGLISDNYLEWEKNRELKFNILLENEIRLNEIFSKIYSYDIKIDSNELEKEITFRKANEIREIKSLISYFVGCIFGRYSLDIEGVQLTNNNIDFSKYNTFIPDIDNIIPIFDNDIINQEDDILFLFKKFISKAFGEEFVEQNLEYISEILGRKGTESYNDTIRKYFINDFYTDHLKIYQKRPVYFLVDSGKKNGFKALLYINRYNNQLLSKIRVDYLHKIQNYYEREKNELNYKIGNNTLTKEYQNELNEINMKLKECNSFDERLGHLANQMLDIELDDGIKFNYEKFADVLAKIK